MLSNPFGQNLETTSTESMALQNPRLLKVRLDGEVLAHQGSMVAYQGEVRFAYEGAGGVGRLLQKALTGEASRSCGAPGAATSSPPRTGTSGGGGGLFS